MPVPPGKVLAPETRIWDYINQPQIQDALETANILTASDLDQITQDELLAIKGVGPRTLFRLISNGFTFRRSPQFTA
jgi:hypothetical protein